MANLPEDFHIWEGIYESFADALSHSSGLGFQGDTYASRSLIAAQECLDALDLGEPIPHFHKQRSTLLPVVASMMLGSVRRVRILDFGGGFGIGYLTLVESLGRGANAIQYDIVEVDEVCELGGRLLRGRVNYMSTLPANAAYDLVHSASALQYVEDWRATLKAIAMFGAEFVLLSDVFAGRIPSFVTLQNYYGSRIPHWFLNIEELLSALGDIGYNLVMRSYVSARRLKADDVLPMDNFPPSHRLDQTLHLLLKRSAQ